MSSLDPEDDSPIPQNSKKLPQYLATFFATIASVSAGTYLSWSSSAVLLYKFDGEGLTKDESSWVGSLLPLGALVGSLPAGWLANKVGRKIAVLIITVPLLLCWFPIGFAMNIWCLYLARFVAGASIGAVSVAVPMYVSDIAEPAIRGTLGSMFQLQITIGVMLGYLAGLLGDPLLIAACSISFPTIFLLTFPFMPESPVWLVRQDRRVDAEKSMRWLRGEDYSIEEELGQLESNRKSQNNTKVGFSELKHHKKAALISLALMVFQQLSGINVVIFYAETIFRDENSTLNLTLCTVILGIVQVPATYISTILVDRIGRKVLLMTSSGVMGGCLVVLGLRFQFKPETPEPGIPWISLISLVVYIVMFAIGYGPIPWLMLGEVSPTNVVGIISSAAATLNWTLAFAVTNIFLNMKSVLGTPLSFGVFAVICATGTIFVGTVVPETKGKTMEEIQIRLHRLKSVKPVKNETVNSS